MTQLLLHSHGPHLFQVPPPFKVSTLGKITAKPFLEVTKPEQMRLNLYTHLLQRLLGQFCDFCPQWPHDITSEMATKADQLSLHLVTGG